MATKMKKMTPVVDKETLKDILLGLITLSGRKGVSTSQLAAAFSKKPEASSVSKQPIPGLE